MNKTRAVLATIIMFMAPCQCVFARRGFGTGFATGALTGVVLTKVATSSSTSSSDLRAGINQNSNNIQMLNDEIMRLKRDMDELRRMIRELRNK